MYTYTTSAFILTNEQIAERVSFEILVNNKPIKQFNHKDKIYVEGRANSEYSLKIINGSNEDICAVISIDGLSINTGKPAGKDSSGYLIPKNNNVVIPGWLIDNNQAAKFTFNDKQKSYNSLTGQDENNVGVIGCLIYRQKSKNEHLYIPKAPNPYKDPYGPAPWYPSNPIYPTEPKYPKWPDIYWTSVETTDATNKYQPTPSTSAPATKSDPDGYYRYSGCFSGASATNTLNSGHSSILRSGQVTNCSFSSLKNPKEENSKLGTEFGNSTEFKTTETTFERGQIIKTLIVYYDNRKNLEKIGIKFKKEKKVYQLAEPNPFPQDNRQYCKPPKNYKF